MIYLFSDASVNKQKNKSIGCYTLIHDLKTTDFNIISVELESKSSTLAEILTIKSALTYTHKYIESKNLIIEITLYVDCMNFVNLINERQNNDRIKNHKNYELYKELFDLTSKYKTTIVWTKGHDKNDNKQEEYKKIFSKIDKTARKLSRNL